MWLCPGQWFLLRAEASTEGSAWRPLSAIKGHVTSYGRSRAAEARHQIGSMIRSTSTQSRSRFSDRFCFKDHVTTYRQSRAAEARPQTASMLYSLTRRWMLVMCRHATNDGDGGGGGVVYVCLRVCVCACVREGVSEREGEREGDREIGEGGWGGAGL